MRQCLYMTVVCMLLNSRCNRYSSTYNMVAANPSMMNTKMPSLKLGIFKVVLSYLEV